MKHFCYFLIGIFSLFFIFVSGAKAENDCSLMGGRCYDQIKISDIPENWTIYKEGNYECAGNLKCFIPPQCEGDDYQCSEKCGAGWLETSGLYCPSGTKKCCKIDKTHIFCDEDPKEGTTGGFFDFNKSIVPCGRHCDVASTGFNEMDECTLCHMIIMLKNVFDLLVAMLIIVSILFLTVAGVMYIVSAGNSSLNALAKGIITKTLTGFAIMLLSWLIVFTVLKFISAKSSVLGSGGSWNEFKCDTTSVFQEDK